MGLLKKSEKRATSADAKDDEFKKVDENFSAIETRYGSGYRWNVN